MEKLILGAVGGFLLGLLVACNVAEAGFNMLLPFLLGGLGAWWGHKADHATHAARTDEMRVREEHSRAHLMRTHRFDEVFVNVESDQFFGVVWDDRRIVVKGAGADISKYSFDSLTDVELEIQTETYSETEGEVTTNRGSQLFGAAVGGAAFGMTGAVVGGLSGSQRTSSVTTSNTVEVGYILRCRFLDRRNPIVETEFYRFRSGVHYWPPVPDRKLAAKRFHAHLSNILHENRTR